MWYVVQVRVGTEENIKLQCQKQIGKEILERCFIPYSEEKKKVQGKWVTKRKVLFSGYVFVITKKVEELFGELKQINGLSKLIGVGDDVVSLDENEVAFLRKIGGDEQIVKMSEGIIENSQVKITSGPLEGMEGWIRKIDRHKRKAWLEMEMFGEMRRVEVGLEVVKKN